MPKADHTAHPMLSVGEASALLMSLKPARTTGQPPAQLPAQIKRSQAASTSAPKSASRGESCLHTEWSRTALFPCHHA